MMRSHILSPLRLWGIYFFFFLEMSSPGVTKAEVKIYEMVLPPGATTIYHSFGYIRVKSSDIKDSFIDLSGLNFTAISPGANDLFFDDDSYENRKNESNITTIRPPPLVKRRFLDQTGGNDQTDDGGGADDGATDDGGTDDGGTDDQASGTLIPPNTPELDYTVVDILIFKLPGSCATKRTGCDWAELGVGKRSAEGAVAWCCDQDAIDNGLCEDTSKDYGRLLVDTKLFQGEWRTLNVPKQGNWTNNQIRYGRIVAKESGRYEVVYANCDNQGRDIAIKGHSVWRSIHGYLPGDRYGFMIFYIVLTGVYLLLFIWYGLLMHCNEESRIPIEKWILLTIMLGLLEMFFTAGAMLAWNMDGYESEFIAYVGIVAGALKRGLSRCLMVMVALGWGVVRDSLGTIMRAIIVLGSAYIGVSVARDLMFEFFRQDVSQIKFDSEMELFDVVTLLTFVVAAIDVIFIMWILDALNNTMEYLENMNQLRKLARFLTLRAIILFAILFATMWAVFALVNTYNSQAIVQEENNWLVDASTEINYLFVLIGVAILWRPNPNAKEYAYVMELPALGGDEGENELELTGVVPSALDDQVDGKDDRFQIDDAEPA